MEIWDHLKIQDHNQDTKFNDNVKLYRRLHIKWNKYIIKINTSVFNINIKSFLHLIYNINIFYLVKNMNIFYIMNNKIIFN